MTFVVISSIFNAFAYTGGPWPLGYIGLSNISIAYMGLGDIFAFLYFGLVATITLPFLYMVTTSKSSNNNDTEQQQQQSLSDILYQYVPYAIQVAVLVTNIIIVNNLRDRHTDVLGGQEDSSSTIWCQILSFRIYDEFRNCIRSCVMPSSASSTIIILVNVITFLDIPISI